MSVPSAWERLPLIPGASVRLGDIDLELTEVKVRVVDGPAGPRVEFYLVGHADEVRAVALSRELVVGSVRARRVAKPVDVDVI